MPTLSTKTLAIIDDDTELLAELAAALGAGYHVITSLGDPGTLHILQEDPPAAIVLDLDLVTFDAFELLGLINGDPALRQIPVLVLSSASDFATFEHAHRAGAAEYVTKPFAPDELRPRIDALLDGKRQRGNGRLKLGDLLVASGLVTQAQLERRARPPERERRPARRPPGRPGARHRAGHHRRRRRPDAHRRRRPLTDRAAAGGARPAAARLHRAAPAHAHQPRRERQPRARHDQPARRHLHRRGGHAHQAARGAAHLHGERVRRGRGHLLQLARQAQGRARRGRGGR